VHSSHSFIHFTILHLIFLRFTLLLFPSLFHPPPLPFFVSPSSSSLLRFTLLLFPSLFHPPPLPFCVSPSSSSLLCFTLLLFPSAFHPPPLPFFVSPSSSSLLRFILLHFRPPYHYTLFHSDSTGTVWVVRGSESADRLRGDRRGQVTARSANCDWVIVPTGALCYAMYLWQLNGLFACMLSSLCLFSGS
jgi:hypothetical protein